MSVSFEDGWIKVPDQTVFMEHDRTDREGRLLERVDSSRLEAIAREMNKRDSRGQLCPLTFGHTDDEAPEASQPAHRGYAREFKAVWDEKKNRWVLKATWYIRQKDYDEARSYPNVSPEYWHQDGILDPISLLRRTPKLDLGQWIYRRKGRVCRYAMESDMAEDVSKPEDKGGHKAHTDPAEKGVPKAHEGAPPHHEQSNEGTGGGAPEGVPPEFHEHFTRSIAHHYASGGHLQHMAMHPHHYAHLMGNQGAVHPSTMGHPHAMGMGGPSSGFVPGTVPGGTTVPPGGEKVSRMQKNQDDIEKTVYEREVAALRGEVAEMKQAKRDSEHERDFYALLGQGYQLNVAKEVKKTAHLDGTAYQEYLADVKENYKRAAGHRGDEMIATRNGNYAGSSSPATKDDEAPLEQHEMTAYYRHQREGLQKTGKAPTVEESIAYARQNRNGH
jgi:hypothetical protein